MVRDVCSEEALEPSCFPLLEDVGCRLDSSAAVASAIGCGWNGWLFFPICIYLFLYSRNLSAFIQESRAAYGIILMTVYWLTAALPLAVTSLLPIVVFPLMDVLGTSQVCSLYFKEANVVFFGGVLLAMGVERSNLHQRIAFRVILIAGANPQW